MTAYIIFIVVHILVILASINISAVSVAIPDISIEYNASIVLVGWVLSIYQLVGTVAAVLIGRISDLLGTKATFLVCAILFTTGSLLVPVAPNIYILILFRLIQSIGGGGMVPVVMSLLSQIFPDNRQRAIGFSMTIFTIGGIIGPSIGGWLVTAWGWRSIFLVNVPFGIIACILTVWLLKGSERKKGKIDYAGAGLLSGAIFAIMIGLSQTSGNNSASGWLLAAGLIILGVVFILLFLRHEKKIQDPIVDLKLISHKPFFQANLFNFVLGMTLIGFSSFLPLFAVTVHKLTTLQSSFILTARSIGLIIATLSASSIVYKWGYRKPMIIGAVVNAVTTMVIIVDPSRLGMSGDFVFSMVYLCGIAVISGIGLGITTFITINATIDLLPQRVAVISGVRQMFLQYGGAISVAVVSLVIESMGGSGAGFEISYWVLGIVSLAVIPAIFFFPEKPSRGTSQG